MTNPDAALPKIHQLLIDLGLTRDHIVELPSHVISRLYVLLGAEDPVYLDHGLVADRGEMRGVWAGPIVAMTETRVVTLHLDAARALSNDTKGATSVTAKVLPRASLRALELRADRNPDIFWEDLPQADYLPRGAHVTLTFADGTELELPVERTGGETTRRLPVAVMNALLSDLRGTA